MSLMTAIQMVSTDDVASNLKQVRGLVMDAARQGARLVVLPENFALMGKHDTDKVAQRECFGHGPIQDFLAALASACGVWIVAGTLPLAAERKDQVKAACLLYDDAGVVVGRYDKLHRFDVQLEENNESYNESRTIAQGDLPQVIETPFGKLGVGICYDLRFPELFRYLLDQGMEVLALPAAFTRITGMAHWEVLLRARAVENLCYVIAANQGGRHADQRETYGHSMIIDPWGRVQASMSEGSGLVSAAISLDRLQQLRAAFPAVDHRVLQAVPAAGSEQLSRTCVA